MYILKPMFPTKPKSTQQALIPIIYLSLMDDGKTPSLFAKYLSFLFPILCILFNFANFRWRLQYGITCMNIHRKMILTKFPGTFLTGFNIDTTFLEAQNILT